MLSITHAAQFLGVSRPTLRRWDTQGILPAWRTVGNHRRYSRDQLLAFLHGETVPRASPSFGISYLYARVSTYRQKQEGNLDRQAQVLIDAHHRQFGDDAPYHVITDYGSGLNAQRKGLLQLLKAARQGKIARIFIAYPDRLTRFGFRYLQEYFATFEIPLITVDDPGDVDVQAQLVNDMMSLLASFSGKLYSLRAHAARKRLSEKKASSSRSN